MWVYVFLVEVNKYDIPFIGLFDVGIRKSTLKNPLYTLVYVKEHKEKHLIFEYKLVFDPRVAVGCLYFVFLMVC
jgi:hypothetical protein